MAPQRGGKRQSGASTTTGPRSSIGVTSKASSLKAKPHLTQIQKQALIDNLQLEITERARNLRAQYALQAQSLRTRLEIRVHRIPISLRKTTIADLLHQNHNLPARQQAPTPASPTRSAKPYKSSPTKDTKLTPVATEAPSRKRKSNELDGEKENGPQALVSKRQALPIQNFSAAKPVPTTRNSSRKIAPSQILSPKSNNARQFPHSPFKPTMSPVKPVVVRPISPLKTGATLQRKPSQQKITQKQPKSNATISRAPSKQALNGKGQTASVGATRRTAAKTAAASQGNQAEEQDHRPSNVSEAASTSTNATTVTRKTRKPGMPVSASTATTKGRVAGIAGKFEGISASGKKLASSKTAVKPTKPGTTSSGRTLRKRA